MGIIRHFSVRTLKQNEVVERMNKILLELAKCMRLNGDLPKSFWVKAVNISCYLINHSPTFAINHRVSKESESHILHLKKLLSREFDMKDLGFAKILEAEYMALIEAAKEALWLKGLVEELGFKHRGVLLQCDSQSVMDLAKNQVFYARTQRDAATAPNVGDRVPYVIVKAAKGAKAYERSEDPIYVLENNIPIDPQYYLENQISKPLLRIFEPILKNASKELLQGGHTRSISISTPSNSGIMRFAKKQLSCIGCKALISNSDRTLCSHCKGREAELYCRAVGNAWKLKARSFIPTVIPDDTVSHQIYAVIPLRLRKAFGFPYMSRDKVDLQFVTGDVELAYAQSWLGWNFPATMQEQEIMAPGCVARAAKMASRVQGRDVGSLDGGQYDDDHLVVGQVIDG
ncbi:hypothetical protein RJ639_022735 [Escallonia herrerae]|uniref:DNA-directed DNA polymerase n=1 Tax=Escallonia herrerae TaxID=1293975 RepID=A0AA89AEW5_9ASTE|nr:hypothetical protein RJ639_022735 [Escallonia herrerae]